MKNIYEGHYKRYIPIVAVYVVILLFLVFVSPGLTPGLDIVGGTQILVQTGKTVDAASLETALKESFTLNELKITATGSGVRIQFKEDPILTTAKKEIAEAEILLETDPDAAKQKAIQLLILFSSKVPLVPDLDSLEPKLAVDAAQAVVSNYEKDFDQKLETKILQSLNLTSDQASFSKRQVGSALGQAFWQNALSVIFIGMICIAIVIFAFFRELIPSLAIMAAAIIDVLSGLAGMSIFGIPLSLSSIPALLMVIGYSVDTDILLTTRVLKKKEGTNAERSWDSLKTGLTMTLTTICVLLAMIAISYFSQIQIIFEISAVLFFGLTGDLLATWLMNAPVLLWYADKKAEAAR